MNKTNTTVILLNILQNVLRSE